MTDDAEVREFAAFLRRRRVKKSYTVADARRALEVASRQLEVDRLADKFDRLERLFRERAGERT